MKVGNCTYGCAADVPSVIPVFPLPAALLLPRADMPLNIFEPRYLAMVDAAMAGDRVIGMVQPDENAAPLRLRAATARRRLRRPHRLLRRNRRRPLHDHAHRHRPLPHRRGTCRWNGPSAAAASPPRRSRPIFAPRPEAIDRTAVLRAFREYLSAHDLCADWESVGRASNETLVNALAMMAPFGAGGETGAARGARPEGPRRDAGRLHRDGARRRTHRQRRDAAMSEASRAAGTIDPRLLEILVCPLTKTTLEYDAGAAGTDQPRRQARLPHPRRHPDHAGRRSAPARRLISRRPRSAPAPRSPPGTPGISRRRSASPSRTRPSRAPRISTPALRVRLICCDIVRLPFHARIDLAR